MVSIPMVDSTYSAGTSLDLADVVQIINDSDPNWQTICPKYTTVT